MVDNYQYSKSKFVQGLEKESPFVSKNWNFINDSNSSSYTNNGLTMVQFDLSSIYNSSCLTNPSEMYFAIPLTYIQVAQAAGALVAPTSATGGFAGLGLKSGYFNLVHGCDVTVDGKPLETFQSYLNAYVSFKLLSQMSQDNLKTLGTSLGMGDVLDNPESLRFNGSANSTGTGSFPACTAVTLSTGGNGISNNTPFSLSAAGFTDFGEQPQPGTQFTNCYNNGLWSRMKKIMDLSNNTSTNLYGPSSSTSANVISNLTKFPNEFKPYYTVSNTNYSVWYDVAIIRFSDLFNSFEMLPMMSRFSGVIRLYVNTGTVVSNISSGSAGIMVSSLSGNTFTGSCPLIQSALPTMPTATAIASALFVGNPINTSVTAGTSTINFASSGAAHFLTSCRVYYPQIQLKAELQRNYLSENRNKKIVYTSIYTNTIQNVSPGGTYSGLVQSGVSNIRGVLIIPLISSSTHGTSQVTGVTSFSQLLSPFDTSPMTTAPISLINLNVSIGGTNVLQNTLNFGFEEFLEQVSLYEKINSGNLGLSCGLINQYYWENAYRVYYVDCTRGQIADLITPRNINITFTNNSLQTIDCLVFTEYFRELNVDVDSGKIQFD